VAASRVECHSLHPRADHAGLGRPLHADGLGALAAVRRGEALFYRAAAHYSGSSLVPYEVRLAYNSDKGSADSATIPNTP